MAEQLKKGSKLHWYQIDSILGRGGFGITYLATDTNLQTQVAIKEYLPGDIAERKQDSYVLPKTGTDGEMYRWGLTRFIDEARILAKFKHHNIVRVHSVFEENNTAYMVMEYEQGNNLELMLRTPQYRSEGRLIEIFDAILSGLEQVHAHNIIHRDIKPANIYIRQDGSPVLLDFGSARQHIAGKSQNMTRILTKGYAPYEQMEDSGGKQGPWTDIYSIGATLYYAVARTLPADSFSRFTKVIQKQPDPLIPAKDLENAYEYSPEFVHAIDMALQFEAKDRPQNVAEFRQLLTKAKAAPRPAPVATQETDDETVLAMPVHPAPVSEPPEQDKTVYGGDASAEVPADTSPLFLKTDARDAGAAPSLSQQPELQQPASTGNKTLIGGLAIALLLSLAGGAYLLLNQNAATFRNIEQATDQVANRILDSNREEPSDQPPSDGQADVSTQNNPQSLITPTDALKAERERLEREREEAEQARIRAEQERQAAIEQIEKLKQQQAERERQEKERLAEQERIRVEQERIAEQKRLEAEKNKQEELARIEAEKKRLEELERQRQEEQIKLAELEKIEAEKRRQQELELQRIEEERKAEAERLRLEQERLAQIKLMQQKEQERLDELKRIETEEQERLAQLEKEEQEAARKAEAARLEEEKRKQEEQRLKEEQQRLAQLQQEEEAAKKAEAERLAKLREQEAAKKAEAERLEAEKKQKEEQKRLALATQQKKNTASTLSKTLLNEHKLQDKESDIQSVSRLFNDFKVQLSACDTKSLSSRSNAKKSSLSFVNNLCREYSKMDLSISNFQSNSKRGVASADINIRRLTSNSGDTVLPSKSWSKVSVKTSKSNGYWSFVEW